MRRALSQAARRQAGLGPLGGSGGRCPVGGEWVGVTAGDSRERKAGVRRGWG